LKFSDRLREDGIDCTIDQYEMSPPEGLWLPPKSRPKIDQNKVDHYPSVAF
jgi:hypothetical protein